MKRIILVLSVAVVMVAMAVATAVPAFALPPRLDEHPPRFACDTIYDKAPRDVVLDKLVGGGNHPCFQS